jgi:transcriptional regulator with XRE-family HTH domain
MSQSELAEAVNVSRNYISIIERGQIQYVSFANDRLYGISPHITHTG